MSGGMWIVHLALFLLLVNAGSAIKCNVCSNAKNVKALYSKDCYSHPEKLATVSGTPAAAGVWDCSQYDVFMKSAIEQYRQDTGRVNTDPATYNEGLTCSGDQQICRSFYYEADFDYINHDKKSLGTLSGSNERVFRSCGCKMDPNVVAYKAGCYDYKQGPIRKRYCQCNNKDACNSAHTFKTNIFAALLVAAYSISRISVDHF